MRFLERSTSILLILGVFAHLHGAAGAPASNSVCLLKLTIDTKQSPFTGDGLTTAPIESKVSQSKLNATGHVWLRVPANSSCPPTFTASNADDLLQQSSLEIPVGASSITFKPNDIKSTVTPLSDPKAPPLANFNFFGLGMGLTGTEPLGPQSVAVGKGTAQNAKATAQKVCSQLILLNGTLDMSSRLTGKRDADVQHVAYNRSLSAGVSVTQKGDGVSDAVLYLSNVTLFLNISPETKDGQGTPGVEFSKATYSLSGDIVARADLTKASNWQAVEPSKVAWATVSRKDAPLIIGSNRPGSPRFIGLNSSIPQECKPTRVLNASGAGFAAAAPSEPSATKSSAVQPTTRGAAQVLLLVALALVAAALVL